MSRPLIEQHRLSLFIADPRTGLPINRPTLIAAVDPITRSIINVQVVDGAQIRGANSGRGKPRPPREDEHG